MRRCCRKNSRCHVFKGDKISMKTWPSCFVDCDGGLGSALVQSIFYNGRVDFDF